MLLPNLYGDIVSDLAAGLVGGLGIVPGANMGETHAVFEAVHGSAPDIAGQGKANPTALMLSAVMMLTHMGETGAAHKLQSAVEATYREGKHLTGDVGGTCSTEDFTDAVEDVGLVIDEPTKVWEHVQPTGIYIDRRHRRERPDQRDPRGGRHRRPRRR